jgi:hypothetical protein
LLPVDVTGKLRFWMILDKGDIRNLDEEVDMVGHETEGMDSISAFLYTFLEQEIEAIMVRGRKEDVLSPIASSYKTHAFFSESPYSADIPQTVPATLEGY